MYKTKLQIMEETHDQMIGAVIRTQCEIDMLTPKTIIITNPKESDFIKRMIADKKHGIEVTEETIAILEDKIEIEKKNK